MKPLEDLKKKEEALRNKEDAFLKRAKWQEFFKGLLDFVLNIIPSIKKLWK